MKHSRISEGKSDRMHTTKMACDMIAFCTRCPAVLPFASKTEIACTFSAYMIIAQMIV